jgi:hypothetical protein
MAMINEDLLQNNRIQAEMVRGCHVTVRQGIGGLSLMKSAPDDHDPNDYEMCIGREGKAMSVILESRLIEKIREKHHQLEREGGLLSISELEKCYNLFKQKFGPDVLSRLD